MLFRPVWCSAMLFSTKYANMWRVLPKSDSFGQEIKIDNEIEIMVYIYIYTQIIWLFLSSELCPIPSDFGRTHHISWTWKIAMQMLPLLLLWVCLLSLNQDIHWREGTTLVMLAKLLIWVCLLSLYQDMHWSECTTLIMLAILLLWVCFESRYTLFYATGLRDMLHRAISEHYHCQQLLLPENCPVWLAL